MFDDNVCPIVPREADLIPSVWCYAESADYHEQVRSIDQQLKVTAGTLTTVPFDFDHWVSVAQGEYPNGLPRPYSDDPTQWIFHGHPCGSVVWDDKGKRTAHGPLRTDSTVLQVAVARLLGYRWPAEQDDEMELADEQREWTRRCEALTDVADAHGIVCISPVRGEASAGERLLSLLAASFGEAWNEGVLSRLLAEVGSRTLDDWLRSRFFEQHCKLFHDRPFVWHIWDGRRRDGFHALVNYHKLGGADGNGRQLLDSLTYSYLGNWIARQRDEAERGAAGAEDRLAAAAKLQRHLESILTGEPPHDIFVRWKPLVQQPIGWEPDIDDGIRMNIRPFMAADVAGGKKGAGILRAKPNVHWRKDRGRELLTSGRKPNRPGCRTIPGDADEHRELRPLDEYPWFWQDGAFTGDRVNDVHLDIALKSERRRRAAIWEDSFASATDRYSIPNSDVAHAE